MYHLRVPYLQLMGEYMLCLDTEVKFLSKIFIYAQKITCFRGTQPVREM